MRVRERLDGTAAISDRRTKQPYKRVKLDANHRVEFWRLPAAGDRPGKVQMVVVPMMVAAADAEAARLKRPVPDRRPHPAARLLMRLHKDDVVAFGVGEARRLLRVAQLDTSRLVLVGLHESGNLRERHKDEDDSFRYVFAGVTAFAREAARKVFVDPAGRVLDPGPLPW